MLSALHLRHALRSGHSCFACSFVGLNKDTGELLAVKQLDTGDVSIKELAALEHEIAMLKGLHHTNIVRYYGTERSSETLSILLEYVPGGSIRKMIDLFGPLGEPIVRAYTRQLLLGLEYLHRAGIAHRDIKVRVLACHYVVFMHSPARFLILSLLRVQGGNVLITQGVGLLLYHLRQDLVTILRCVQTAASSSLTSARQSVSITQQGAWLPAAPALARDLRV